MLLIGGRERTEAEYRELLRAAHYIDGSDTQEAVELARDYENADKQLFADEALVLLAMKKRTIEQIRSDAFEFETDRNSRKSPL